MMSAVCGTRWYGCWSLSTSSQTVEPGLLSVPTPSSVNPLAYRAKVSDFGAGPGDSWP